MQRPDIRFLFVSIGAWLVGIDKKCFVPVRAPKGLESIAQALAWVIFLTGHRPEGAAENRAIRC